MMSKSAYLTDEEDHGIAGFLLDLGLGLSCD